ncbi:MAG: tRNA 2-thiouridine(34) synthase MnmA [bacterium]
MKGVLVGMSGGIDSSVCAYLLKEKGYNVIGITFKMEEDENRCCEISDVKNIAAKLGIPHYSIDIKDSFKRMVIDEFVACYKNGITPNPCIMCNKYIKFNFFLKKAQELDVEYIATGHYARIEKGMLKKGIDLKKDQSYFLYPIKGEYLKHILMPLGCRTKDEVIKIAKKLGFPIKKESSEICFIPDNDYKKYLLEKHPDLVKEGPILDKEGNVLGSHPGISFFTIGQREKIGISARKPLYVIRIDKEKNAIIVGEREGLYKDELNLRDINMFVDIEEPRNVSCKIRYRSQDESAIVRKIEKDRLAVKFEKPQFAITPGQSVVFYEGDIVLGGGIIE